MRFAEFADEWQITSLSNLGSFTSGTGFPEKYQGDTSLDIPFYKVSDMNLPRNTKYMLDVNNTVDDSIIKQLRTRSIDTPSIVFAKVGAAIFGERKRIVKHRFLIDNNMMAFTPNNQIDLEFCHACFYRTKLSHYTQIGALPSYNASDLSIINFGVPSMEEQRKIAKFIILIDNKIEKHACLVEHLKKYKRGVVKTLLDPKQNQRQGVTWTTDTIGNLGTFIKGAALSKADISDFGTPFILYGELYTTYKEVVRSIVRTTQASVDDVYLSKIGDVVIPTSGETPEEISTASCIMVPNVILAGDLNIYRSTIVDGRIMSYLLNHIVNEQIARVAQGKSVVHVQASEVGKISITYPDHNEQERIAQILELIDNRIAVSEKNLSSMQKMKKALLQQIFI